MSGGWRLWLKAIAAAAVLALAVILAMAGRSSREGRPVPETVRPAMGHDSPPAAAGNEPLVIPVRGVTAQRLTDTFTQARAGGARRHDAIDILAPRGTPVIAAAAGRVEKLFLSKDGGNTVYVRSRDGRRMYYYAHLDRYDPALREGLMLRQGSAIGAVGSTGNADPAAPHLHFAIWMAAPGQGWWQDGTALNPYPLLRQAPSD